MAYLHASVDWGRLLELINKGCAFETMWSYFLKSRQFGNGTDKKGYPSLSELLKVEEDTIEIPKNIAVHA